MEKLNCGPATQRDIIHRYKEMSCQAMKSHGRKRNAHDYHRRAAFQRWVGKISWRRKRQPTPVFLPGESHGQRHLAGCSPWGHKESETPEQPAHTHTPRGERRQSEKAAHGMTQLCDTLEDAKQCRLQKSVLARGRG